MQLSCGKQLGNGEAEIGDLSTPQQARTAIQIQSQGTKGNILEKFNTYSKIMIIISLRGTHNSELPYLYSMFTLNENCL